ncbi:MAG TPA: HD domain-containing protein [Anaerolineales bacterium]
MPTIETARSWYPPSDPVHGFDHVLRVYRLAERLARAEGADLEIVRAAVLLHDAAPELDAPDPPSGLHPSSQAAGRSTHHHASAAFARQVLQAEGWPEARISAVEHCIRAHRFRDDTEQPQTLEAQVLFDADKLDAIGAIGVARAIAYAARDGCPAYAEPSASFVETGQKADGELHSSYHEFLYKLRKLKGRMYTASARLLAEERHHRMEAFYIELAAETRGER